MKTKISCLMICFNNQQTINQSIDSILNQHFKDFELLIIDNASADDTPQKLKSIDDERVKIIYNEETRNISDLINKWLLDNKSKYVCFSEPDMTYTKDRLLRQFEYMESAPRVGASGTQLIFQNVAQASFDFLWKSNFKKYTKVVLLHHNPFSFSTMIFRRSSLMKYGLLFDSTFKNLSFYNFIDEASQCFSISLLEGGSASPVLGRKKLGESVPSGDLNDLKRKQIGRILEKYTIREWEAYLKLYGGSVMADHELNIACDFINNIICANQKHRVYPRSALYKFFRSQLISAAARQFNSLNGITRSQLINLLIQKFSYTSYLEIGTSNPTQNFDLVQCPNKTAVDPEPLREDIIGLTSDAFFENLPAEKKFDLIFIDGLHHADQVTRDIDNAITHLAKNGSIVCHDMLPETEEMQMVPRISARWMGDC
ncbi:glycosyltransferase [Mucilaginibacter rubeus]|uniref:Glycosyltransferase n=1 Tax=Mucilaginibacter rubeus TaxID=2027860 RepID=A0AAE6MJS9_9SPHI|nr:MULTISPECIES: glycosyltransferase [Mucilaginibacter]QEM05988.1 glycosyltransferase [Mucilaginibacter rubeus]QEM18569.1 glycosyltransferase [Mucilaginibacter gossypii]QTE44890.1 glycosyltransferase [Mucilaginibacter rubeus]QTE51488.1 glycosyltransferase [Mucilaginibacter rubeus]QTE56574.1 glycosyltransferase [Mucilaginibacter rubeus]